VRESPAVYFRNAVFHPQCVLESFGVIGVIVETDIATRYHPSCPRFVMDLVDIGMEPSYGHELVAAFSFPIAMFVLALIPGLNFLYSGHGGPAWLLIPLCFPSVIVRAAIKLARSSA
jgi:hypothetical protein